MAKRRLILLGLAVLAIMGALLVWRSNQRADRAEAETGLASARVLDSVFERTSKLQVATLSGRASAQSVVPGLFESRQTTRAPFSATYTIDLRRIDKSAYRWNERDRIMTVQIPAVAVGKPSIDMTRAETQQSGVWISRRAGQNLQRIVVGRLDAVATREASKPENVARAQEAARVAVARLIEAPLAAAGQDGVRVVIRMPGEEKPAALSEEQWDVSRSLEEIYRDVAGD
ncbi:DUF4230 domain-containing protein [uncultured Sphingomonas sp.]|uniref:DUF4230 domain-containing protein n=1 Tax=uncultured Sphingomonas sp. TaxID=158754 RepID=UPI0035CA1D0A